MYIPYTEFNSSLTKSLEYSFIYNFPLSTALTVSIFVKIRVTEYIFMNNLDTKFNPNRN